MFTIALPGIVVIAFVCLFGANVPEEDELHVIPLLDRLLNHLSFEDLWSTYSGHRMFFSRLIFLAFARWTNFNVKDEMVLGSLLLVAAVFLVVYVQASRAKTGLWSIAPASFLMLTLAQYEQLLHGFAVAWYLVTLCFAIAVFSLDRVRQKPRFFSLAIIAAVVGTFSAFQGLLIWPACFAYVLGLKRNLIVIWLVAFGLVVALYAIGYQTQPENLGTASIGYGASHPLEGLAFALVVAGGPLSAFGSATPVQLILVGIFGAVLVLCGSVVIASLLRSREIRPELRLPVALIIFGMCFVVSVVPGRAAYGVAYALQPRFTSYSVFIIAGVYLALASTPSLAWPLQLRERFSVIVVLAIATGYVIGIGAGPATADAEMKTAYALRNFETLSDEQIEENVNRYPPLVRASIPIARRRKFSLFAGELAVGPNILAQDDVPREWSVPKPFSFSFGSGAPRITARGNGTSLGKVYVGSPIVDVVPGSFYRISATIDARGTSGDPPCIYIAELPSGLGIGMTCAVNGTVKHYSGVTFIDRSVRQVKWQAYSDDTVLAPHAILDYSAMSLNRISP